MQRKEHGTESQTIDSSELNLTATTTEKKPFVEPEVSVPVDVLEATTFQAAVTSGTTN
ncbi:MAG TPA: hypothetical protein VKD91_12315 [Pyrinomonadaceae bacterium]|nr:hypothetical protein [Pyrinomonadaceae bacterium]